MNFFIYELDERQIAISNYLSGQGHTKVEYSEINSADVIVLPFNTLTTSTRIDSINLNNLKPEVKVFTGITDKALKENFSENSIALIEFMNFKEIIIANSIPTAEGVLYYLLSEMKRTIYNSQILVIGYGVCGSEISQKLIALNANVDILEVSDEKKALAKLRMLKTIDLNVLSEKRYDAIINTVPMKVLNEDQLQDINKDTLILDIASSPFGFDSEILEGLGIPYKRILGLPSRFGVEYSGEMLGEFILKYI